MKCFSKAMKITEIYLRIKTNMRGDAWWSPEYFFGKNNTVNVGVTFGF